MKSKIMFLLALLVLVSFCVPLVISSASETETNVFSINELRSALSTAQDGDIINLVNDIPGHENPPFVLTEDLVIPKGVIVNYRGDVDFYIRSAKIIIQGSLYNYGVETFWENGDPVNHTRLILEGSGAIYNSGAFINECSLYLNDRAKVVNDNIFINNAGIGLRTSDGNSPEIVNNGVFASGSNSWFGNGGILNNAGKITNSGITVNSCKIYNSGEMKLFWLGNDAPGVIENRGTILILGHINNNTGQVLNYGDFTSDAGFYQNSGSFINYGDFTVNGGVNNNGGIVENYGGNVRVSGNWEGRPLEEKAVSVEVTASVQKLKGNQNLLTITITEHKYNSGAVITDYDIMIDNNAAGIYLVGGYKVYVDTKGNTDVRACYFK